MKNTKSRKKALLIGIPAGIILVYLLMLFLLLIAERSAGDSTQIQGFGDAFWYSLITLTTVGYGDLYPVTAAGRLIGGVFSLLSLGLLAMLISLLVSCIRNELIPLLLLRLYKNRMWIIFTGNMEYIQPALNNCVREYPDSIMIISYPPSDAMMDTIMNIDISSPARNSLIRIQRSVIEILSLKNSCHQQNRHGAEDTDSASTLLFILGCKESDNLILASAVRDAGYSCSICCRAAANTIFAGREIACFDDEQIISRRFWMEYGLRNSESRIVLIGSSKEVESLLEHGLTINIKKPLQTLQYDVFCDDYSVLQCHYGLGEVRKHPSGLWSVLIEDGSGDKVCIHTEPWYSDMKTLSLADRIIICGNDQENNLGIIDRLEKLMGIHCDVYMRSSDMAGEMPNKHNGLSVPHSPASPFGNSIICYGMRSTIFTPELMLQEKLNDTAKCLHAIYCGHTGTPGTSISSYTPGWEALGWFTKASNIAAADHLVKKLEILLGRDDLTSISDSLCREAFTKFQKLHDEKDQDAGKTAAYQELLEIEHIRWARFHLLYNWSYAEIRDNEHRQHPMLVPFDSLSPEDQEKDAYAWEMIGIIGTITGDETNDRF